MFSFVYIYVLTLSARYIHCDSDDHTMTYRHIEGPMIENRFPPLIKMMPDRNLLKRKPHEYSFESPHINSANNEKADNFDLRSTSTSNANIQFDNRYWSLYKTGYEENNNSEEYYDDSLYDNEYSEEELYDNEFYEDESDYEGSENKRVTPTRSNTQNTDAITRTLPSSHKDDNDKPVASKNMTNHSNQFSTEDKSSEIDTSNKTGPKVDNRFMPSETIMQNWGFYESASEDEIQPVASVAPRSSFINIETENKSTDTADRFPEIDQYRGLDVDENEDEKVKINDTKIETKSNTEKTNRSLTFINNGGNDGNVLVEQRNHLVDRGMENTTSSESTTIKNQTDSVKTYNNTSSNSSTVHVICPFLILLVAITIYGMIH